MSALLDLASVSKTFESGTIAQERLSLSVEFGEFVSLVGPSGCGKSTALRLIAGLMKPDGGTVTFPAGRPEIGFVFQEPTLMPWARALENVRLPIDLERRERIVRTKTPRPVTVRSPRSATPHSARAARSCRVA